MLELLVNKSCEGLKKALAASTFTNSTSPAAMLYYNPLFCLDKASKHHSNARFEPRATRPHSCLNDTLSLLAFAPC